MKRPSEKALKLGEELFDYVAYGLQHTDAMHELAELVDESNRDLLAAVRAVLHDAQRHAGVPAAYHVAHLERVMSDYEPITSSSATQRELTGMGWPGQLPQKDSFTLL